MRFTGQVCCINPVDYSLDIPFACQDDSGQRMEIIEIEDHPFFIGCQYHPEFKSRPGKPAPLFLALAHAGAEYKTKSNAK